MGPSCKGKGGVYCGGEEKDDAKPGDIRGVRMTGTLVLFCRLFFGFILFFPYCIVYSFIEMSMFLLTQKMDCFAV